LTKPDLKDVQAAAERIAGRVRRTPMMAAAPLREAPGRGDFELHLKLECLQIIGSFKARGAMSKLTSLDEADVNRGLITASGGNHGLAVAYAGWAAGVPARIHLPESTPEAKVAAIESWGATTAISGAVWDDANVAALAAAEELGMTYVHPFADPLVIAGQGTLALEIAEELPDCDVLLVAIGGGGLIAGISLAMKALRPQVQIVGVEPVGAPTLKSSIEADALVELSGIHTRAGTLAPRRSEMLNFEIIRDNVDEFVLVDDDDMRGAAQWLWREFGVGTELSGAATVAALRSGAVSPQPGARVCALVCGAGGDGLPDEK
jgi:threonine dehydratase